MSSTYYIQFNTNIKEWMPKKFHCFTTINFCPKAISSSLNTFRLTIIKE